MPTAPTSKSDKVLFAIAAGVVVLIAACLPLAQRLDDLTDRTRPMYDDRDTMEWLQYQSVTDTGSAVPLELGEGESVRIADEVFTPSPGVTVVVRIPAPGSYCIRVSNQHGDVSQWACLDEENPPTDPGAPPDTGL